MEGIDAIVDRFKTRLGSVQARRDEHLTPSWIWLAGAPTQLPTCFQGSGHCTQPRGGSKVQIAKQRSPRFFPSSSHNHYSTRLGACEFGHTTAVDLCTCGNVPATAEWECRVLRRGDCPVPSAPSPSWSMPSSSSCSASGSLAVNSAATCPRRHEHRKQNAASATQTKRGTGNANKTRHQQWHTETQGDRTRAFTT